MQAAAERYRQLILDFERSDECINFTMMYVFIFRDHLQLLGLQKCFDFLFQHIFWLKSESSS